MKIWFFAQIEEHPPFWQIFPWGELRQQKKRFLLLPSLIWVVRQDLWLRPACTELVLFAPFRTIFLRPDDLMKNTHTIHRRYLKHFWNRK